MKKLFLNWLVLTIFNQHRDEGPIKFCQDIFTIIADCKVIINVMKGFTCCMHAGVYTDPKTMANCHESEQ